MIVTKEMNASPPCLQKDKWATPEKIFAPLHAEFGFTLDPCAEPHTAKCPRFYTEQDDGLSKSWDGEIVFVNPPYSRDRIGIWMKKCHEEAMRGGGNRCCAHSCFILIPLVARTRLERGRDSIHQRAHPLRGRKAYRTIFFVSSNL